MIITLDHLETITKIRDICRELDGLDASISRHTLDIVAYDKELVLDSLIRNRQIKFNEVAELIWQEQ